jgi:hypothetical protein
MKRTWSYVGAIALNAEEKALFDKITLNPDLNDEAASEANTDGVPKLMDLLESRCAIPQHRLDYFNDPQFRSGKVRGSHRNLFERNGTTGKEIYEHDNFLKHLRYFLLGADLPETVIHEFRAEVQRRAPISSGDVQDLSELAKALMNKHRLEPYEKAEEFFKLCLDCGVHRMHAEWVKNVVGKMRLRKQR